jgi:predicted ribosome quality control (RQC) complex YloA/Tae2 family protein
MSNQTTLNARNSGKNSPDSPEKMQQTITEQQKTIAMQYDLLQEAFTKNELLMHKVQELEKQLQEMQSRDGYNSTSSWISKITFTLQQENRPLRSPEMISLLEKKEPSLAAHHNKVQYFSAFLSNAVKYSRIMQSKMKGVRGYYYLLPHWLDEKGQILPEYVKKMW